MESEKQRVCHEQIVTLDVASMVKATVSQQVETMKTKSEVSQQVEVDATLHYLVGSISSGIPSVVTPSGDWAADMDIEPDEKDGSDAARGTNGNSRRWVIKKHVSHLHRGEECRERKAKIRDRIF